MGIGDPQQPAQREIYCRKVRSTGVAEAGVAADCKALGGSEAGIRVLAPPASNTSKQPW